MPAWVTSPAAPIEDCYVLSRERLGPMFGRYGGRPDEAEGGKGPLAGVEIVTQEWQRAGAACGGMVQEALCGGLNAPALA